MRLILLWLPAIMMLRLSCRSQTILTALHPGTGSGWIPQPATWTIYPAMKQWWFIKLRYREHPVSSIAWLCLKKENGRWQLWHQTTSPLLEDGAGGMMGNPFDGIKIERRAIVIAHFGGSRDKWNYTHRYRFQNDNWYLIGASVSAGAPCDYWISLDYNLSTGDAEVSSSHEECDKDAQRQTESWTEKIKLKQPLPLMDQFIPGETRIRIAKRDFDIYY